MNEMKRLTPPEFPGGHWLFRHLSEMSDPIDLMNRVMTFARTAGPVVALNLFRRTTYVVRDAPIARQVLADLKHYKRVGDAAMLVGPVVGVGGLVLTDGDVWKRQLRLVAPAFHAIDRLLPVMEEAIHDRAETWLAAGHPLSVRDCTTDAALEVLFRAMFQYRNDDDRNVVAKSMSSLLEDLFSNFTAAAMAQIPLSPAWWRFRRAKRRLDHVVMKIITEHKSKLASSGATVEKSRDVLTRLMLARDEETGQGLSDQELISMLLALIFAGHDTTAATLAWAIYYLEQKPELKRKFSELCAALPDRSPTKQELKNVPAYVLAKQLFLDALLLDGPVFMSSREVRHPNKGEDWEPPKLEGYELQPGQQVLLPFRQLMHWNFFGDSPPVFDPEAHFPHGEVPSVETFFPFNDGLPHNCIGKPFSEFEAQVVLTRLYGRYRVRVLPLSQPLHRPAGFLLRPPSEIMFELMRR